MNSSLVFFIVMLLTSTNTSLAGSTMKKKRCLIPEKPINWIMLYCAAKEETDDEVAIQESDCFARASDDLSDKNECKIKAKYKKKYCQEHWLKEVDTRSNLKKCMRNNDIPPFVAGD